MWIDQRSHWRDIVIITGSYLEPCVPEANGYVVNTLFASFIIRLVSTFVNLICIVNAKIAISFEHQSFMIIIVI